MNKLLNGVSHFLFEEAGGGGATSGTGSSGAGPAAGTSQTGNKQDGSAGGNKQDGSAGATSTVLSTGSNGTESATSGSSSETASTSKTAETGQSGGTTSTGASTDGKTDGKEGVKVPDMFGADWRETAAGEDKAKLNILKRYTDPKAAIDALFALQEKVRAGDKSKPLPKDATPEQTTAWRKDNGIPEKPEEYLKGIPEGMVIGDADKAAVDAFLTDMHGKNVNPEIVSSALTSYLSAQKKQTEALQAADVEATKQTNNELRAAWGTDYDANISTIKSFLQNNFPADIQQALMNARLGDDKGTPLFANTAMAKAFAELGRQLNPTGTIAGGQGADSLGTIDEQLKAIEPMIGSKAWYKDEAMQAKWRNLQEAKLRLTGKG